MIKGKADSARVSGRVLLTGTTCALGIGLFDGAVMCGSVARSR